MISSQHLPATYTINRLLFAFINIFIFLGGIYKNVLSKLKILIRISLAHFSRSSIPFWLIKDNTLPLLFLRSSVWRLTLPRFLEIIDNESIILVFCLYIFQDIRQALLSCVTLVVATLLTLDLSIQLMYSILMSGRNLELSWCCFLVSMILSLNFFYHY